MSKDKSIDMRRLGLALGLVAAVLLWLFLSPCPEANKVCGFVGLKPWVHKRLVKDEAVEKKVKLKLRGIPAVGTPITVSKDTGETSPVIDTKLKIDLKEVAAPILNARNKASGLSPSHLGHPGYQNLAFLYDKAVDALVLKAAGYDAEAEAILDYFSAKLFIPRDEIKAKADTNEVFGIMKLFKYKGSGRRPVKAVINAIDVNSSKRQGKGQLEFHTTPGPMSFMIFAMLTVNPEKYKFYAITLGDVLLTMQDRDGGIRDGDRAPEKVHTEPHVDACAALYMLHQVTGDQKWKVAADKAAKWFRRYVFHPRDGIVDQGLWSGKQNKIFAEDCYSWTMAGPIGDKMSLEELKKVTDTVLRKALVRVTVSLPDGSTRTLTLVDFTDPQDEMVRKVREGFHPMGSIEWTGGAILGLQKNAVRFWIAGDEASARFYKAMAELLMREAMNSYYYLDSVKGLITFYGSGQGVEIAPFGSIESGLSSGWKTPYYYVKGADGNVVIKGGSLVGAWPILPYKGLNPFILKDDYKEYYDTIPVTESDMKRAEDYFEKLLVDRSYTEVVPVNAPESAEQIVEPGTFTAQMWAAFEAAYSLKEHEEFDTAESAFREALRWAHKVVENPTWIKLAKRDNAIKEKEFGGIIAYPWGMIVPENGGDIHIAILRYPILNEVGAAIWGLATANFELGNYDETKKWMRELVASYPLHQIPVTEDGTAYKGDQLIKGYWNALTSWEDSVGGTDRDSQMGVIYRQVLKELGKASAKPKIVVIPEKE